MTKISKMRNLGPASEQMLKEIDIHDAETLKEIGVEATWNRLRFRFGDRVSKNLYYALRGDLEDKDWRSYAKSRLPGTE